MTIQIDDRKQGNKAKIIEDYRLQKQKSASKKWI